MTKGKDINWEPDVRKGIDTLKNIKNIKGTLKGDVLKNNRLLVFLTIFIFFALCSYSHADRFQHNNDGTVTDTETGLMWQLRGPQTPMNWEIAKQYCNNLILAGYSDWRLPSYDEIGPLKDYFYKETSAYMNYFPDTKEYFYWGDASAALNGAFPHLFAKGRGGVSIDPRKWNKYYVRAVRGAP